MSPRFGRLPPTLTPLLLALAAPGDGRAQGEPSQGIDPEAGLPFWAWEDTLVELRLIQRLPDQTRGFFIARGFTSEASDRIARSCVFQSIQRNRGRDVAGPVMEVDLTRWRLTPSDGAEPAPRPIALKEDWDKEWKAAGESEAARVAFRWSLFPTRQTFRGGDYNWGMISFGVAPGTRFDLTLDWTLDGVPQEARLKGLICAPETVETEGGSPD
ncbi:MAG: hypothetical protein ACM3ST_06260 [Bdellovibrio bacteriovorus]